jgi:hypothetical protein
VAVVDFPHRVCGVQDQVEQHLLKLDAIAVHDRQASSSSVRKVT